MVWMHETEEMIAADKKTIIDQNKRILELETELNKSRGDVAAFLEILKGVIHTHADLGYLNDED